MTSVKDKIEQRAMKQAQKRRTLHHHLKIMEKNLEEAEEMKLPTVPFLKATYTLLTMMLKDQL